jgi:hypothetical protein
MRHRPAPWKLDVLRKAVAFYHPWWKQHRSLAFVPWQTAAYAEAYRATREPAFAACVFEMNDWLGTLQYDLNGKPEWRGGFKGWTPGRTPEEGRAQELLPTIGSAVYIESLCHAARVAALAGDEPRRGKYLDQLGMGLQFLMLHQYGDTNTGHFAEWYRPHLLGGFYASAQDGTLRIDFTQHAVSAMVVCMEVTTGQ